MIDFTIIQGAEPEEEEDPERDKVEAKNKAEDLEAETNARDRNPNPWAPQGGVSVPSAAKPRHTGLAFPARSENAPHADQRCSGRADTITSCSGRSGTTIKTVSAISHLINQMRGNRQSG